MPKVVTSPDEQAFPPRFWWLKRLTVVMLLLAGVLVGLRYLALHIAKRRLEAGIAAGERSSLISSAESARRGERCRGSGVSSRRHCIAARARIAAGDADSAHGKSVRE